MNSQTYILKISEVKQASGGYDHVVIFDAEILLLTDTTSIELTISPPLIGVGKNAPEIEAIKQIKMGLKDVLFKKHLGAIAEISNLKIHPVDFIPQKFRKYTIKYFSQAINTG